MTDLAKLEEAFDAGSLLRPALDKPNLVDLANAIGKLVGVSTVHASTGADYLASVIGPCDHLVLVVADGLGLNTLEMTGKSFIGAHAAQSIQSVFPTSTPVVLTTLATGLWPNEHTVTGWFTYYREINFIGVTIRFVRASDDVPLGDLGLTISDAFPAPSLWSRSDRDSLWWRPAALVNDVFAGYTSRDNPQRGYETFERAVDAVMRRVRNADGPTFTYLYTPAIDSITHRCGVGHDSVIASVRNLDREIERLAENLPENARVVLTADHGLLDVPDTGENVITASSDLVRQLMREPWGTGRAVHFDVASERTFDFERAFSNRLGNEFFLLTVAEAEGMSLFGPGKLSPLTRARLGSHMALSKGPAYLSYQYQNGNGQPPSVSHHLGLSPAEMLVPLMVY